MAEMSLDLRGDGPLSELLAGFVAAVQAAEGSILLADDDGESMRFALSVGPSADRLVGQQVRVGQGLVGLTMAYQIGSSVADVKAAPAHDPTIDEAVGSHTEAMLAVPISSPSREWGVLTAINPTRGEAFTHDQLETANRTAAAVAERLEVITDSDGQP
ncbi:MAG: GAF domain-containing protein [Planctomycetota bacterium]